MVVGPLAQNIMDWDSILNFFINYMIVGEWINFSGFQHYLKNAFLKNSSEILYL